MSAVWVKPELEFHRPEGDWTPSPGAAGGVSDLLLSRDPGSGDSTLLQRYDPGGATRPDVITHPYWEEVLVVSGELTDETLGLTATAGTYACRPPGMRHGPYTSATGCLLFVTTRMP